MRCFSAQIIIGTCFQRIVVILLRIVDGVEIDTAVDLGDPLTPGRSHQDLPAPFTLGVESTGRCLMLCRTNRADHGFYRKDVAVAAILGIDGDTVL